jgi:hypothetical protein
MPQLEVAIVGPNNTKAVVTGQEELLVKVNSVDPGTGLATEATLVSVADNTSAYARSASVERTSTTGSNTVDVYSISFSNVGAGNVTVQGTQLEPGETINFDAGGLRNAFRVGTISWDALGGELLIIYVAD